MHTYIHTYSESLVNARMEEIMKFNILQPKNNIYNFTYKDLVGTKRAQFFCPTFNIMSIRMS